MSSFREVMEYAREHLPAISADIDYSTSPGRLARASAVNAAAELMRRINYVPNPASLGDNRGRWHGMLSCDSMCDPKQAARTYRNFANDMNGDMVNDLLYSLQCRAEGRPMPTPPWRRGVDSDAHVEQPNPAERASPRREDQELEAVVGRLLESAPLDDETWGAW